MDLCLARVCVLWRCVDHGQRGHGPGCSSHRTGQGPGDWQLRLLWGKHLLGGVARRQVSVCWTYLHDSCASDCYYAGAHAGDDGNHVRRWASAMECTESLLSRSYGHPFPVLSQVSAVATLLRLAPTTCIFFIHQLCVSSFYILASLFSP